MSDKKQDQYIFQNIHPNENELDNSSISSQIENYDGLLYKLDKNYTLNPFEKHIANKICSQTFDPQSPNEILIDNSLDEVNQSKSKVIPPKIYSSLYQKNPASDKILDIQSYSSANNMPNYQQNSNSGSLLIVDTLQPIISKIDLRAYKPHTSHMNPLLSSSNFCRFKQTFPMQSYNLPEIKAKYEKTQAYINSRNSRSIPRAKVDYYELNSKLNIKFNNSLVSTSRPEGDDTSNFVSQRGIDVLYFFLFYYNFFL